MVQKRCPTILLRIEEIQKDEKVTCLGQKQIFVVHRTSLPAAPPEPHSPQLPLYGSETCATAPNSTRHSVEKGIRSPIDGRIVLD